MPPETPSPDRPGRDARGPRWLRHALPLLLLAQLAIGLYGVAQPVAWGHQGFHVGEHGLAVRNLLRHGAWAPTRWHGPDPPPVETLSFHHPTLFHPYLAVGAATLGDTEWVYRGVSVLFHLFALGGLWAFTVRARGRPTAAVACAAWVLTPLEVAFVNLPDTQIPAIAWTLWWGAFQLDLLRSGRLRHAALALGCAALAGLSEWPFFPIAFFAWVGLGWLWLRGHATRPAPGDAAPPALTRRRLGLYLVAFAAVVLVVFGQHFVRAWAAGRLPDLLSAFHGRGTADQVRDFLGVLSGRIERFHTWPLVAPLAAWLLVVLPLRRRDPATLFALALLVGQSVYLWRFQVEFMVHEYRSLWYVPVTAFAAADVTVGLGRLLARPFRAPWVRGALTAALAAALLAWPARAAPDMARLSRARAGSVETGGYDPHDALMVAARAAHALTDPSVTVHAGGGLDPRPELFWVLDRRGRILWSASLPAAAVKAGEPVAVLDEAKALLENPRWRGLVAQGRLMLVGPVALLDLRPGLGPPSVEAAEVVPGPPYGPVAAFLHAPRAAPLRLAPGAPRLAAGFARALKLPEEVIARAEAGETPLLDALPPDLRAAGPAAPPPAPTSAP